MDDRVRAIPARLLGWYDAHARRFPWRAMPGGSAPDPYRVWLSEVMLQQTTTAAVVPYFEKFTARWGSVENLAAAPEDEVMAAWAGLGYYSRARNLIACAREVALRGGFPSSEQELRKLPGIGAYTAAAVAAIAFGNRAVVIDANVERVVARLFAIRQPLPSARRAIRAGAESITPARRPGDFAQAMMDLGATVCTPRDPNCLICPVASKCEARASGDAADLPIKPVKKPRPERQGQAFWIEREGKVWLVRRPRRGMLGGMRALPDDGWSARGDGSGRPPFPGRWRAAGQVRHGFTHFGLTLALVICESGDWGALEGQDGEWWPLQQLEEAGLPTLFSKAAMLARALS